MVSSIFACKIREAIISLITERAAPLRRSLNRRCRERAACALISHRCGSNVTNNHRDSLKFVQEVARFVTSHFFWKRGSEKSVNWQHCVRISTHLSVWLQHHTHFQTYTRTGISGPRPIRGGVPPFTICDCLDHNMGLMCVCCWTTWRLSESQRLYFSFLEWLVAQVRPQIFFSRTIEKLGRTLEPCV